jgi:glycosyltransferase involved in cell wall biosynthesis
MGRERSPDRVGLSKYYGVQMNVRPEVLFFVEGYTDIRFVTGLSEICDLTMAVPARTYQESGLEERVKASGARLQVEVIPGGRLRFQIASFFYLLKNARKFDVILCQEFLRGAFNGTVVGALTNTPVITYMGIAPLEYFRCRREREQIGPLKAWLGETVIRFLMTVNGKLATRCLAMGPYLRDIAAQYCPRSEVGLYYGVDTAAFCPASDQERVALRQKRDLPLDKFIIFLSSRISHEKDPETVLRATALARQKGLDAVVINLGGGYKDFLKLARELNLENADQWVLGRPAAHPVTEVMDYFRAADVMALASLAEGAAYSTLEALSCGTPVVCTAVGGMLVQLGGYARLTPRRHPEAMCNEFLWIAANPDEARKQALLGREYIQREWNRQKAFADLASVFAETMREGRSVARETA